MHGRLMEVRVTREIPESFLLSEKIDKVPGNYPGNNYSVKGVTNLGVTESSLTVGSDADDRRMLLNFLSSSTTLTDVDYHVNLNGILNHVNYRLVLSHHLPVSAGEG